MAAARPGYFDTSVLIKGYVAESGTSVARGLMSRHQVLSSAIAPAEAMSAVYRRRSGGELDERDLADILAHLATDRRGWELIAVTSLVVARAEALIRERALRTLDALHVASALIVEAQTGHRVPFITADSRQRLAAERVDLEVVWVE
jgi:uncharacterized protein